MPNNKFSQISLLDIYEDVNTSFMERHSNESKTRLDNTQKEYAELKEQAQEFDIDELYDLR